MKNKMNPHETPASGIPVVVVVMAAAAAAATPLCLIVRHRSPSLMSLGSHIVVPFKDFNRTEKYRSVFPPFARSEVLVVIVVIFLSFPLHRITGALGWSLVPAPVLFALIFVLVAIVIGFVRRLRRCQVVPTVLGRASSGGWGCAPGISRCQAEIGY
jgi:hypothetical protein